MEFLFLIIVLMVVMVSYAVLLEEPPHSSSNEFLLTPTVTTESLQISALRADVDELRKDIKAVLKAVGPAKPDPTEVVKAAIDMLSTAF